MHTYGHWPDHMFNKVSDASYWIGDMIAKFGRIHVSQCKEKFGTARVYCGFGFSSLYWFIFPKHNFVRINGNLYWLDLYLFGSRFVCWLVNLVLLPYQRFVYRRVYAMAVKKWPEIKNEILNGADFQGVLKGL